MVGEIIYLQIIKRIVNSGHIAEVDIDRIHEA